MNTINYISGIIALYVCLALLGCFYVFVFNFTEVNDLFGVAELKYKQGIGLSYLLSMSYYCFNFIVAAIARHFIRPNYNVVLPPVKEEEDEA